MDNLRKILIIALSAIVVFFVAYGAITLFLTKSAENITSSEKDTEKTPAENEKPDFIYSFSLDDDNDELSNAKEIIYDSNPNVWDTDGDSYSDGDEVKNGYDPTIVGSARLSDNENLNVTIKYFNWVTEKYGVKDPIILDSSINEYLDMNFPDPLDMPEIAEEDMNIIDDESESALRTYINAINKIELPEGFSSYSELYEKALAGERYNIDGIITEINDNIKRLYLMETPEAIVYIHEEYIGIMEILNNMFTDLKNARKDPVKIKLNIRIGKELVAIANDLEEEKKDLLAELDEED